MLQAEEVRPGGEDALTRASWRGTAQGLELPTRCVIAELYYWLHWDAKEGERLVLDRSWPGQYGERIVWCDGGDDSVARQGREIGEQRVEAVHRQSVRGQACGLFGDSGRGE